MTTGRINQVAIVRPGRRPSSPRLPRCREPKPGAATQFRELPKSLVRTSGGIRRSRTIPGSAGPNLGRFAPALKPCHLRLAVDVTSAATPVYRACFQRRPGAKSPWSAPPDFPLRKPASQDRQVMYRSYTRPTSSSGPQFTSGLRCRTVL